MEDQTTKQILSLIQEHTKLLEGQITLITKISDTVKAISSGQLGNVDVLMALVIALAEQKAINPDRLLQTFNENLEALLDHESPVPMSALNVRAALVAAVQSRQQSKDD